MIVALVPAHADTTRLRETLGALTNQTVGFDRIVVVGDEGAATAARAAHHGSGAVEVFEARRGDAEAPGALDLALLTLGLDDRAVVVVVEPGVAPNPGFVAGAIRRLDEPGIGAVVASPPGTGDVQRPGGRAARLIRTTSRGRAGSALATRMGVLRELAYARADRRLAGIGAFYQDRPAGGIDLGEPLQQLGYVTLRQAPCPVAGAVYPTTRSWGRRALGAATILVDPLRDRIAQPHLRARSTLAGEGRA